jgi:hypothetical protein
MEELSPPLVRVLTFAPPQFSHAPAPILFLLSQLLPTMRVPSLSPWTTGPKSPSSGCALSPPWPRPLLQVVACLLPTASGVASTGGRICYFGRPELLLRSLGGAATGRPASLPRATSATTSVGQSCCHGLPELLPRSIDDAATGRPTLLPTGRRVLLLRSLGAATMGVRRCCHGRPELLVCYSSHLYLQPRAGSVATLVTRRCYHQRPALLPTFWAVVLQRGWTTMLSGGCRCYCR